MFTFIEHFDEIFKFLNILVDVYVSHIVYLIERFKSETFNDIVSSINDSTMKIENDFRASLFNHLVV